MTTPAERYAANRRRAAENGRALTEFQGLYDFELDPFQLRACRALESGHGVLVAAPTGSGKTVVGEFGVHLALAQGMKCFYTTPIKALSNQKYADLVRRYGPANVGLLTGDNTVNGAAPVVVMTTEVLRNMLYAGSSTLAGLAYVVMDEVHYLADRFRGAVWEEVIIHLPESVRLVALSATVSNAEEFGEWLHEVRGDTAVIVDEHRPVPLWQHMLAGNRLYDLFVADHRADDEEKNDGRGRRGDEQRVNPELLRLSRDDARQTRLTQSRRNGRRGPQRPPRHRPPSRPDVIDRLDMAGLLPAITFVFSRAGCEAAVEQCLHAGLRLTSREETEEIRSYVEERTADIPDEDLLVLGYGQWLTALERGIAAHHAGMLPTFKEVVEELFVRGLIKAVFATETLALGINMPARSVVIERLVKWNGESHADLTAGEYTQLTGRAGRRGIDIEGHAVVLWAPGVDPGSVAGLAGTRTYPLNSSFRPSYNMAVNLVGQVGRERARALLESSFAQFQADRAVVGLSRQLRRHEEALEGYQDAAACHLGDFMAYARLRRRLTDLERDLSRERSGAVRAETARSLERLRPGDVIMVPAGRWAGAALVLEPGAMKRTDDPAPLVLTVNRQVKQLAMMHFSRPVEPIERIKIPKGFSRRSAQHRRDLAATLRTKADATHVPRRSEGEAGRSHGGGTGEAGRSHGGGAGEAGRSHGGGAGAAGRSHGGGKGRRDTTVEDADVLVLRLEIRNHPCHGCADREEHARWAERYLRLERETGSLRRRVEGRSQVISRTFDRVCAVLDQLGYLTGDTVTDEGRRLARLYSESDLLAAECLRSGIWDDLDPAELAACVSVLVYESRRDDEGSPRIPAGPVREACLSLVRLWGELEGIEKDNQVSFLREPDLGFVWAAFRWAKGHRLDAVLTDSGLPAGDFVRWIKQLLDLLGQLTDAAPPGSGLRATAGKAMEAIRRGVVAYSSVT